MGGCGLVLLVDTATCTVYVCGVRAAHLPAKHNVSDIVKPAASVS